MVQNFSMFKFFHAGVILMILGMCSASNNLPLDELQSSKEVCFKLLTIIALGYVLLRLLKPWLKMILIVIIIFLFMLVTFERNFVQNKLCRRMFAHVWQHRSLGEGQTLVNDIQRVYHCCGFNGPQDYKAQELPSSCCANLNCENLREDMFSIGCSNVFDDLIIQKY